MILVHKGAAPARLARGLLPVSENSAAVDADPISYKDGHRTFDFDKEIYGHTSVKTSLKAAQHNKCCYCEGRFSSTSSGDVEHYRPKKGVYQDVGKPIENPGYYWLAYSWSNLYYSCEICNRGSKRSLFPLRDPTKRARLHTDNIGDEQPMLLDPGGPDDPRDHIHFREHLPHGITPKGEQTIKAIKLDRLALNDERWTTFDNLRTLKKIVEIYDAAPSANLAAVASDARRKLANAIKADAIYSAMAQDFLR